MVSSRKTPEQFRTDLAQCNPNVEPIEQYINSKTNILVQCSICRFQWKARPSHLLSGHGCPQCAHRNSGVASHLRSLEVGNSLSKYPLLANEWDYEKNSPLLPENVSSGSNKEYWWRCKEGHVYFAKVCNRVRRNDGCPYCSRHKPIIGENDLKSTHSALCLEWNYEKNGEKRPESYMAGSSTKVWWKCRFGHEWEASIGSRTRGNGCPCCSKRFRTSFPEQAIYFYIKQVYPDAYSGFQDPQNGISELDVYIPSIRTGIEYDGKKWHSSSAAEKREQKKYIACKKQEIRLIRIREDNCETSSCDEYIYSGYAVRNQPSDIDEIIVKLFTLLRHEPVNVDVVRDRLMIEESYYGVLLEKSIANKSPSISKEWDYRLNGDLTPQMVSYGSSHKYWWVCSNCGESYEMSPASRTRGYSCPKCGNIKKAETHHLNWINNHAGIDKTHPELIDEWDYFKNDGLYPAHFTKGNQTKVWWKCKVCGHSWKASIDNRTKGRGCPQCRKGNVGKKIQIAVVQKEGSLLSKYPDLCKEWDIQKNGEITPDILPIGSGYKAFWICTTCGQEYSARVTDRVAKKRGCPKCGKRKAALAHSITASNGRKILCLESGNIFDSMKEAAESIGQKRSTCISNCLHGKQQTAGGYHWKYVD